MTTTIINKLHGDYELIIEQCLGGDPKCSSNIHKIKRKVAEADTLNRGGLASLKYHLNKAGVTPTGHAAHVLRVCELDQETYADLTSTDHGMKGIDTLPSGKYRVRVNVEHNRFTKTFDDLISAKNWRDRMSSLNEALD